MLPVAQLAKTGTAPDLGVGETLTLRLHARDLFGNRWPRALHEHTIQVLFSDPLMPVASWPGAHFEFAFDAGGVRSS